VVDAPPSGGVFFCCAGVHAAIVGASLSFWVIVGAPLSFWVIVGASLSFWVIVPPTITAWTGNPSTLRLRVRTAHLNAAHGGEISSPLCNMPLPYNQGFGAATS